MGSVPKEIDLELLQPWVGREDITVDVISPELVRRFCATFNIPTVPQSGEVAPGLIHFCLTPPAAQTDALGEDGHPTRGGFLPPVPLPRRMWAGGSLAFHSDLRVGDVVKRTSHIEDVVVKSGSTGPLCFVSVEHRLEVEGVCALVERQGIVYCGPSGEKPSAATNAQPGENVRHFDPSPPLLFRYSALTFNGHRIHYDRRYAVEVEGYAGLVVQGPLQATILFHQATAIQGRMPTRFKFRSYLPLFDNTTFEVSSAHVGKTLKLWTARSGGPIAMRAEAEWK